MKLSTIRERLTPRNSALLGLGLLVASAFLLWAHANAVREMKEVGLPAAVALPRIEKRMDILREQNELAELQASLRGGTEEELLNMYVLPENDDIDRLLATFDVLFSYLEQKRELRSFSAVTVGEREEFEEGVSALPIAFEADVTEKGLSDLLLFADISGLLTVSDALDSAEIDQLLALTEEENPAAVTALEHFLSSDLLRYGIEPQSFETQLRKSFASPVFAETLQMIRDSSRLRRARELFADLGPVLQKQKLWPTRLLTVERVRQQWGEDGTVHVAIGLRAYVRD